MRIIGIVVISIMLAVLLVGCGGGVGSQTSLQQRSIAASDAQGPAQEDDLPPPLPKLPDWAKEYAPVDPYATLGKEALDD